MNRINKLLKWVGQAPVVAHFIRAAQRYMNRLGNQFAGSITFFSVLAIVPILMFAFAALGLTLTVIRPQWMGLVQEIIRDNLMVGPIQEKVLGLVEVYLFGWQQVGIVAIIVALVVGSGWMNNLKNAIRGVTSTDFDLRESRRFFLWEPLFSAAMLLVLMVLIAVSFALSVVGVYLAEQIVRWLNLENLGFSQTFIQVVSLALGWLFISAMFMVIYVALPQTKSPRRTVVIGSGLAGACFLAVQGAASLLSDLFSANRSIQLFGPIIVTMLVLNIFARLLLFWASWIATATQPAIAYRWSPADEPLRNRPDTITVPGHWEAADRDRESNEALKFLRDE